jgi:hypothetical protein
VSTVVRLTVKRLRLPASRALHEADNSDFAVVEVAQMRSSDVRDDIPSVGEREVWTSSTGSDILAWTERSVGPHRRCSATALDVLMILIVWAASEPARSSPQSSVATVRQ